MRDNLPSQKKADYDVWICNSLWNLVAQNQINVLHSYIPMGSEIDITAFLQKVLFNNIKLIVPKPLKNGKLEHLELTNLDQLRKGVFGTFYPFPEITYEGNYDLILVPGLAYDNGHYRIGYGGGYYDRFLSKHPDTISVGAFYPFQKVPAIPIEHFDVPLSEILVKNF